jgi:hypothetical protein
MRRPLWFKSAHSAVQCHVRFTPESGHGNDLQHPRQVRKASALETFRPRGLNLPVRRKTCEHKAL